MNSLLQEGLMATKNIQHAAIIRQREGGIKAKSNSFAMSPQDFETLEEAFANPASIRAPGATFNILDTNYRAVRADKLAIYAKHEKSGIAICKTNQYYVLVTYDSSMYASVAVEAAEKLAEYLRKKDK